MNSISDSPRHSKTSVNGNGQDSPSVSKLVDTALIDPSPAASTLEQPPDEAMRVGGGDVPRFTPLTLVDLAKLPPKQWMIGGIIGPGDKGTIFGAPGCGKTFTAIDMAIAASLGKTFAGRFHIEQPLTVAYTTGEGRGGLAQRFIAATRRLGVKPDELTNLLVYTDVPQLYDQSGTLTALEFMDHYIELVEKGIAKPLDLLFIDTQRTATNGAAENSPDDMNVVLHRLDTITRRLGCTVILVHHTNKAGTGERGTNTLRAGMDVMIKITGKQGTGSMECDKLKDGEQWKSVSFNLKAQADSVYVEWGAESKSSVGGGKDKPDRRRSDTKRRILGLLYEEYNQHKSDGPGRFSRIAKEIASAINTSPTVATKNLRGLEELGFAQSALEERNSSRVTHWSISSQGTAKWESIQNDESELV